MIVLDASAVVELTINRPLARRIAERTVAEDVHAPHLLEVEVAQALRRLSAMGEIEPRRAKQALDMSRAIGLVHHGHDLLLERVWELRSNLTAYDAAYVALAEALDAPLITCDRPLAAAPGHRAAIELIA